jgi:hypothetical protein
VQGGGLRLKHLATTLPGNWNLLLGSYGPVLIGLAGVGAAVALYTRPLLFLYAAPYTVVAFLFFSCWSRSDYRYQIGVFTMLALLASEGLVGPIEAIARRAREAGEAQARTIAMGVAVAGIAVALWASPFATTPPLALRNAPQAHLGWMLPLAVAVAATIAAGAPRRALTDAVAVVFAVGLSAYAVQRASEIAQSRAGFQQGEVQRAQATIRQTLEPRSVVITTEGIGRPMENLEYYGGVYAVYLTDLVRWKLQVWAAAASFIKAGLRPYLLIDDGDPEHLPIVRELERIGLVPQKIASVPPQRNYDFFVAAPFHRGLPLSLYRISYPLLEEALKSPPTAPAR